MSNEFYKLKIYDDNRIMVQYNNINTFNNAHYFNPIRRSLNDYYPYMSTKDYVRTIRRKRKELFELNIDKNHCIFLSLTTEKSWAFDRVIDMLKIFIRAIRRTFSDIQYIRAIESYTRGVHFHIHLLIIFNNNIPKAFNSSWVNKHWEYGITDFQKVFDPYGFIDYITLYKDENINHSRKRFTKFPKNAKIISSSRNIPKSQFEERIVDEEELEKIFNHYNNKNIESNNRELFVFKDGHYYVDDKNGPNNYCLDKEYWH